MTGRGGSRCGGRRRAVCSRAPAGCCWSPRASRCCRRLWSRRSCSPAPPRAPPSTPGWHAVEQDAFTGASANLRVTWDAVLPPASERFVRRQLAALPVYGPPVVTGIGSAESRGSTPFVAAGAAVQPSALYYRDGAVERLGGTAGSRGVWLATDVADALGVQVGDPVRVGLKVLNFGVAGATTVVAGTFDRADGSALPVQLAGDPGISARDLAWDPDRPGEGRPLMIADRATFGALVRKIHQQPLWTADLALPADVTPQQAREAVAAVQRLGRRAFDDTTPLAAATNTARPRATRLSIASGLPDIVTGARETAATVRDQVAAFVGAGVGARGRRRLRGRGPARPQQAARAGPAVRARDAPPRGRGPHRARAARTRGGRRRRGRGGRGAAGRARSDLPVGSPAGCRRPPADRARPRCSRSRWGPPAPGSRRGAPTAGPPRRGSARSGDGCRGRPCCWSRPW